MPVYLCYNCNKIFMHLSEMDHLQSEAPVEHIGICKKCAELLKKKENKK